MSVWEPPKNDQTIRRSYWNERKRAAQLASIRNRKALENGGPVKLDSSFAAAIKETEK